MNKISLILIIICFLLIGCKASEELINGETAEERESTGPKIEIYEQLNKVTDKMVKKAESELLEMSRELLEIIAKADNVESMEYSYSRYIPNQAGYFMHVYVRGNKIKQVHPMDMGTYTPGDIKYDTVYLDIAKKTAEVYCEDPEYCEDTDALIDVDYEDFVTETPLSLLRSIKYAEIKNSVIFDKKEATIIEFNNKEGNEQNVWLWNHWGVPLKYEIYDSSGNIIEKVAYRGLVVNRLENKNFIHISIK